MRQKIPLNIDFRDLINKRVYRDNISLEVKMVRVFEGVAYLHADEWSSVGYTFGSGLWAKDFPNDSEWECEVEK